MSAAEQVFEVLEEPAAGTGNRTDVPNPAVTGLVVDGLLVTYPGRITPVLDGISLVVEPGKVSA